MEGSNLYIMAILEVATLPNLTKLIIHPLTMTIPEALLQILCNWLSHQWSFLRSGARNLFLSCLQIYLYLFAEPMNLTDAIIIIEIVKKGGKTIIIFKLLVGKTRERRGPRYLCTRGRKSGNNDLNWWKHSEHLTLYVFLKN